MISGLQELLTARIKLKRAPAFVHVYIDDDKKYFGNLNEVVISPDETPELIDFRALHFLSILIYFDNSIPNETVRRFMEAIVEAKPKMAVTTCFEEETEEYKLATYSLNNPQWIYRAPEPIDFKQKKGKI